MHSVVQIETVKTYEACDCLRAGYLKAMSGALAVPQHREHWPGEKHLVCMSLGQRRSHLVSWVAPQALPEETAVPLSLVMLKRCVPRQQAALLNRQKPSRCSGPGRNKC